MPDRSKLEKYRDFAKEDDGVISLWIDQSSDPQVKTAGVGGVCFAMARAFVLSCQAGGQQQSQFYEGFSERGFGDSNNRVPRKYIDLQLDYAAETKAYQGMLGCVENAIKEAKKQRKQKLEELLHRLTERRKELLYGILYSKIADIELTTELSSRTGFAHIFEKMYDILNDYPDQYFLINMFRAVPGNHAIAFGFRPDAKVDGFPHGIFQYFDANLGLFVFRSREKLKHFFTLHVWNVLYRAKGYTLIEVVAFRKKSPGR